jgi:hypothetical protein
MNYEERGKLEDHEKDEVVKGDFNGETTGHWA